MVKVITENELYEYEISDKDIKYYFPGSSLHRWERFFFIIVEGKRVVAAAELQENPYEDDVFWVQYVCTAPSHIGRGYARLLIEKFYEWANEKQVKISPSSFTKAGQKLKHIFSEMIERYPITDSGETFKNM